MRNFDAGSYISQGGYNTFQPTPIIRLWELDDMEVQFERYLALFTT